MKGYVAKAETGRVDFIEDDLPFPEYLPSGEGIPRNLASEIDELKAKVMKLESAIKSLTAR